MCTVAAKTTYYDVFFRMKSGTAKLFLQSGMVIENCQFATYNNIIKLNLPGIINFIKRDTDFLNNKNRFILVIIRNSIISLYAFLK